MSVEDVIPPPPTKRRRRWRWIGGGAAVVALGGIGIGMGPAAPWIIDTVSDGARVWRSANSASTACPADGSAICACATSRSRTKKACGSKRTTSPCDWQPFDLLFDATTRLHSASAQSISILAPAGTERSTAAARVAISHATSTRSRLSASRWPKLSSAKRRNFDADPSPSIQRGRFRGTRPRAAASRFRRGPRHRALSAPHDAYALHVDIESAPGGVLSRLLGFERTRPLRVRATATATSDAGPRDATTPRSAKTASLRGGVAAGAQRAGRLAAARLDLLAAHTGALARHLRRFRRAQRGRRSSGRTSRARRNAVPRRRSRPARWTKTATRRPRAHRRRRRRASPTSRASRRSSSAQRASKANSAGHDGTTPSAANSMRQSSTCFGRTHAPHGPVEARAHATSASRSPPICARRRKRRPSSPTRVCAPSCSYDRRAAASRSSGRRSPATPSPSTRKAGSTAATASSPANGACADLKPAAADLRGESGRPLARVRRSRRRRQARVDHHRRRPGARIWRRTGNRARNCWAPRRASTRRFRTRTAASPSNTRASTARSFARPRTAASCAAKPTSRWKPPRAGRSRSAARRSRRHRRHRPPHRPHRAPDAHRTRAALQLHRRRRRRRATRRRSSRSRRAATAIAGRADVHGQSRRPSPHRRPQRSRSTSARVLALNDLDAQCGRARSAEARRSSRRAASRRSSTSTAGSTACAAASPAASPAMLR